MEQSSKKRKLVVIDEDESDDLFGILDLI